MNVRSEYSRLVTVSICALMFLSATMVPKESDRMREGLAGRVRQITTTTGGTATIRRYDPDGALTETVSRLAPAADEPDAQEQVRKFLYIYDAQNQRLREMSQDQDGPPYVSRRYAYDAGGRQRAEAAYHMCGTFSSLHVFSYEGDGRLLEQLTYQFRSLGKRVYEYDSQGHLTTLRLYKNGVLQSTTHYRYDDKGRLTDQTEVNPDGTAGNNTAYEYDENGRLKSEQFTNLVHPSLDAVATYEYDREGNWTTKTTRRKGSSQDSGKEQVEVTERMIEYY
jgi:YD repeat-containing protein